ncbi:exported hypothetical protein [Thiomonas sp. CB2]|nr:exported hypothetical protein [Thiomonas sp. CB2]
MFFKVETLCPAPAGMGFLAPARSQTRHYRQVSGFVTGKCLIFRRVVAARARRCPCSLYLQEQRLNYMTYAALQQSCFYSI